MDKPCVAVFSQRYLSKSMTFVYRQMIGVKEEYHPIVLVSNEPENQDLFPYDHVFAKPKNVFGRLYRASRKLSGDYAVLSKNQMDYFTKVIKEHDVKLVHAHFGPSGIEIYPIIKKLKIPLLLSFHGYDASMLLKNERYVSGIRPILKNNHITTPSVFMKDQLIPHGASEERWSLLHYGIPLDFFRFVPRKPVGQKLKEGGAVNLLQVSNFNEKKGHKYTIEAFAEFQKKYSNCTLTLGGDGELLSEIKEICISKGISEKVKFPGRVNQQEVLSLLNDADVFLHHSITSKSGDSEGIPNVIMEAMATGLPVISTYHAGIPELIDDGINGFLVKEKDVKAYTDCLLNLVNTGSEIGERAYEKVKRDFNLTAQSHRLMEIYNSIIG